MHKKVIDESSAPQEVRVRRRNTQGSQTTSLSITLPNELNQTINGMVATTAKSRSLIISELLKKGLRNE